MSNDEYREAQQQARQHGLKARHELRLENATYTAAEVKVLTEAALRIGRAETRVLLIKPGDVLLVGNLGTDIHPESLSRAIGDFSERTGVKVYVFAADIDIDKIPAGDPS